MGSCHLRSTADQHNSRKSRLSLAVLDYRLLFSTIACLFSTIACCSQLSLVRSRLSLVRSRLSLVCSRLSLAVLDYRLLFSIHFCPVWLAIQIGCNLGEHVNNTWLHQLFSRLEDNLLIRCIYRVFNALRYFKPFMISLQECSSCQLRFILI